MVKIVTRMIPIIETGKVVADMAVNVSSQCSTCQRWKLGLVCQAFPKGIPKDIWKDGKDHSKPFPGDNGLLYKSV